MSATAPDPGTARADTGPFTGLMRVALAVVGLGSWAAGVLAVFETENGTGSAALVTVGVLLLFVGLLGNRIESIELGGAKVRLKAQAAEKLALADRMEQEGDPDAADRLREQAHALLEAAGPVAADYRAVRGSMPAGPERTGAMERVVAEARRLAREQEFDAGEVARWLREGSDEERVTALGLMQASPHLRDLDGVLAAIEDYRSPFEHYHALRLALLMVPDLGAAERARLAAVVLAARGLRMRRDAERWRLSEEILRAVDQRD